MYLIQMLLPLRDNDGHPFPGARYAEVRRELTERFGGVTAYLRSPAQGAWKEDDGRVDRDDVVIFEVMTDGLDRDWWRAYRRGLEERFRQKELVIRATEAERL